MKRSSTLVPYPQIDAFWSKSVEDVVAALKTTSIGLDDATAAARLAAWGPNSIQDEGHATQLEPRRRLAEQEPRCRDLFV